MADRRGKYIIIGIFALGLLAAGSAWLYRYSQTRQAAIFWGGAGADTILTAERIDLFVLQKSPPAGEGDLVRLTDDSGAWYLVREYDVTQTRGMLNARNALVHDGSLDFSVAPAAAPDWQYALCFRGQPQEFTVLLDLKGARAKALGRPGVVGIEAIAEGFDILFREARDQTIAVTSP